MSDNVEQKVKKVVGEVLGVEANKISTDSKFVEDLGADSLDMVELMMAIEAAFDCEIPDDEAIKITTIAEAIKYIQDKTAA